jgi:hypothetical protein
MAAHRPSAAPRSYWPAPRRAHRSASRSASSFARPACPPGPITTLRLPRAVSRKCRTLTRTPGSPWTSPMRSTPACLPVFDGPGGKDALCQTDSNCQASTGLRCVLSAGSTRGACEVPLAVQGGGSCSASNARCVTGYHCGPIAHCDIDAALGEPCDNQTPCGVALQCSTAGTCVAKGADGSACASGAECVNGICNKSMTSAMGLCVSQVNLAPNEPFCVDSR